LTVTDQDSVPSVESRITALVLEYALHAPTDRPLGLELSLRDEIGLDSFSLVSLMLRLGEEFNVDLAEESSRLGINLEEISTFGDLVRLGRTFSDSSVAATVQRSS
jgi:acyl carrier protein